MQEHVFLFANVYLKYLNGEYYVEVKNHRYRIHPTENKNLRKRDPSISLRTQYQFQNETWIRKNQNAVENNGKLENRKYSKNEKPVQHQPKFKPPNCPSCKRDNWLEFDKSYYCKNCEYIINKQKHQIDKKILRQDRDFSTRINYANKKKREVWMNLVNTTYNSTEDIINKLQELEGKTKLKFYKNISNYYDNMNIRMDEDPFAKNVQRVSKILHEVLMLTKFLQTKPQIRNMNIK